MGTPGARNRSALDTRAPAFGRTLGATALASLPEDRAILRFRLAAIFAAQLFDFATFMIMVKLHGITAELNPLVADGFELGGFRGLFVFKLALIVLVSSTIVILGRNAAPRTMAARLAAVVTVIAVGAGVLGGFSNAITI